VRFQSVGAGSGRPATVWVAFNDSEVAEARDVRRVPRGGCGRRPALDESDCDRTLGFVMQVRLDDNYRE
jgi:hypothetical protein